MSNDPCKQWDTNLYPNYETDAHREREERAREVIAERIGFTFVKIPDSLKVDWRIYDKESRVCAYAEFKCRTMAHDRFKEVILSAQKANAGFKLGKPTPAYPEQFQFFFFGQFTDGIWKYHFKWDEKTQEGFPRRDGDPRPAEKVVLMPSADFTFVCENPIQIIL